MQITNELLDKIAALSKLEFSGDERESVRHEFQRMLDFIDQLQAVDTTGIEPLIHITQEVNHLREDKVEGTLKREDALKNAPQQDGSYFRVPKVLDK